MAAAATTTASGTSLASVQRHRPMPCVIQANRKVPVSSSRASNGAPANAGQDFATYLREIDLARQAAAGRELDETFFHTHRHAQISVRRAYVHMIEEYARHNGHADCCASASMARKGSDGSLQARRIRRSVFYRAHIHQVWGRRPQYPQELAAWWRVASCPATAAGGIMSGAGGGRLWRSGRGAHDGSGSARRAGGRA